MKFLTIAIASAVAFLASTQKDFIQQAQEAVEEAKQQIEEVEEQYADEEEEFLEEKVAEILENLPDNLGITEQELEELVVAIFGENDPHPERNEKKVRDMFEHIKEKHEKKFAVFGKKVQEMMEAEEEETKEEKKSQQISENP